MISSLDTYHSWRPIKSKFCWGTDFQHILYTSYYKNILPLLPSLISFNSSKVYITILSLKSHLLLVSVTIILYPDSWVINSSLILTCLISLFFIYIPSLLKKTPINEAINYETDKLTEISKNSDILNHHIRLATQLEDLDYKSQFDSYDTHRNPIFRQSMSGGDIEIF